MKNPPIYEELVQKLVRVYDEGPSQSLGVFQNPVTAYTDQARLESEQRLLRSLPMPVAHVSQLPSAGSCLVHDALGVPILIIPEEPQTDKARTHWELNYELIQNGVFKGEDLWVCEQIQKGLASGANERMTYGIEEASIQWWHDELDRRIEELS